MQTLTMYVSVFVKLAEVTYHKNFNHESVFSLLGAFKGVAAISHILVKDALESVNYVEYGSSNYSLLVQDTGNSWNEYEQNINNLEEKFRTVLINNNSNIYEVGYIVFSMHSLLPPILLCCNLLQLIWVLQLLRPTMEKAITLTILFVSQMVTRHERVLTYIPGKVFFFFSAVWHKNVTRQNTIHLIHPCVS